MNNFDKKNDNALAYAGISVFGNPPTGPSPQWHELSAWRAGTLSTERSAQILSYVANDPDSFQQWLDLIEAEQWIGEDIETSSHELLAHSPSPSSKYAEANSASTPSDSYSQQNTPQTNTKHSANRRLEWLRSLFQLPLPVYGGAFAAIMLAVLLVPMLNLGNGHLQQQLEQNLDMYIGLNAGLPSSPPIKRNTRSLSDVFAQKSGPAVEHEHFRHGMRMSAVALGSDTVVQWQAWTAKLPTEAMDCKRSLQPEQCESSREDLTTLGQWALLAHAACQPSASSAIADNEIFWEAQYSLFEQLSKRDTLSQSALFGPILSTLGKHTPESLCTRTQALISAGL